MMIRFHTNVKNEPPGKLADAELHFNDGPLEGLKLMGFAVWQRRTGTQKNVTFPARSFTVNGERRSFALLRTISGTNEAGDRMTRRIIEAYEEWAGAQANGEAK